MKKSIIIGIIVGVIIIGIIGFYLLNSESEAEIFCPDYDGNEQECSSHLECNWSSDMDECERLWKEYKYPSAKKSLKAIVKIEITLKF